MKEILSQLDLAETYLLDGALHSSHRCLQKAMQLAASDYELSAEEDTGDVSTHLLSRRAAR